MGCWVSWEIGAPCEIVAVCWIGRCGDGNASDRYVRRDEVERSVEGNRAGVRDVQRCWAGTGNTSSQRIGNRVSSVSPELIRRQKNDQTQETREQISHRLQATPLIILPQPH